jgi:hypothetical protein
LRNFFFNKKRVKQKLKLIPALTGKYISLLASILEVDITFSDAASAIQVVRLSYLKTFWHILLHHIGLSAVVGKDGLDLFRSSSIPGSDAKG